MTIELSQLMLNLYVLSYAGSFLRHAVDMHSLCEYYDLYGVLQSQCDSLCPTSVTHNEVLLMVG